MSSSILPFAEAAADYCEWCESPPGKDAVAEAARAVSHLSLLYHLAAELPLPDDIDDEFEPEGSDNDTWHAVAQRCAAMPFKYYSEVFDPHAVPGEEPIVHNLANDVADIHRDLIGGLELYRAGHVAEAQFDWRFTFEIHWGRHAVSALRGLHCWQAQQGFWGRSS